MKYCTGVSTAAGKHQDPDESQRASGALSIEPVVVATDERQHEECDDARRGADQTPLECAEPVLVLEEEIGEHRRGEQREPHGREGENGEFERADLQQPGECRFGGDRRRLRFLDHFSEDVLLLELTPWRFRKAEREKTEHRDRDAEDQEGPPPPVRASGGGGDAADEERTDDTDHPRGAVSRRARCGLEP